MEFLLDDGGAGGSMRLQESACAQRQPHRHRDRVPTSVVHAAHALKGDRPSRPAEPYFHRPFLKIARSFHQFCSTAKDSIGAAVDHQNRIAPRDVHIHQISANFSRPVIQFSCHHLVQLRVHDVAIADHVAFQDKRIGDRLLPFELIADDVSRVVAAGEFAGRPLVDRLIERWVNEVMLGKRQFRIIVDLDLGRLEKALPPTTLVGEFQPHGAEQAELVQH